MLNNKRILGLICARGGSRGLPRKNLLPFGGQPMIARAVNKLLSLTEVDRTVVSSDDAEIISVARTAGADVPFARPAALAMAETPMLPVVRHCLQSLSPELYDYVLLIQANSPLSKTEDMRKALRLAIEENMDVVFSVTECPHPPQWSLDIENDVPRYAFVTSDIHPVRRQDEKTFYRTTGAFTCASVPRLLTEPPLQLCLPAAGQRSRCIVTDIFSAVDIDDYCDYIVAKAFLDIDSVVVPEL